MNNPNPEQPHEEQRDLRPEEETYHLRPLSMTVEEITDMEILHDGMEMKGQVDIKLTHEGARELFRLLSQKLMQDPDSLVTFSLWGKIK